MYSHRFILEKYSGQQSRFTCPKCRNTKEFTKYIDTTTGEDLSDNIGICNRVTKCGYHLSPAQSGIVKSVDVRSLSLIHTPNSDLYDSNSLI